MTIKPVLPAPMLLAATIILVGCEVRGDGGASTSGSPPDTIVASEVRPSTSPRTRYGVGTPATPGQLSAWNIDVNPAGVGLPPGRGTHSQGVSIYARQCASCHGQKGEGIATNPKLVGRDPREGFPFGTDLKHVKTVGNYWPYATTLYDYVYRAMPLTAPGSLRPDEVYSLVAWLLAENEIIPVDAVLDPKTLPEVTMPAKGRFVRDERKGGAEFR